MRVEWVDEIFAFNSLFEIQKKRPLPPSPENALLSILFLRFLSNQTLLKHDEQRSFNSLFEILQKAERAMEAGN